MGNKTLTLKRTSDKKDVNLKIGQKFNLILYSFNSIGEGYNIINYEELDKNLKLIKKKSKYCRLSSTCSACNETVYTFKCIKEGNIQIKVNYNSSHNVHPSKENKDIIETEIKGKIDTSEAIKEDKNEKYDDCFTITTKK